MVDVRSVEGLEVLDNIGDARVVRQPAHPERPSPSNLEQLPRPRRSPLAAPQHQALIPLSDGRRGRDAKQLVHLLIPSLLPLSLARVPKPEFRALVVIHDAPPSARSIASAASRRSSGTTAA